MARIKYTLVAVALLGLGSGCGKHNFGLPQAGQEISQSEITNSKVDVVFMIDNSSSMARQQKKLNDQLPGLIAALNAQGMDWKVGITTSDLNGSGGELEGAPGDQFITSQTSDYLAKIISRAQPGENGSDLERGIDTVKSSLSKISKELRSDAMLNILFLSDDDDYSATSAVDFVKAMDALKPPFKSGFRSWVANYIGATVKSADCLSGGVGSWVKVGQKYIDIVNATGGVSESICASDFSTAMSKVRVRMNELLTEFPLDREPKVETIVIKINGANVPQSVTNGWEYIPGHIAIKFHGNQIPRATDVVTITFDPVGPK